jgi:hypothetical protein
MRLREFLCPVLTNCNAERDGDRSPASYLLAGRETVLVLNVMVGCALRAVLNF